MLQEFPCRYPLLPRFGKKDELAKELVPLLPSNGIPRLRGWW